MTNAENLSELSKTLFIPLAVRAQESAGAKPLVKDEKAEELFRRCDLSGIVTDGGGITGQGILARTVVLDAEVGKLLAAADDVRVINLGAGLDTRFFRLDNQKVRWYELDLPEVISLRKSYIEESDRLHFVAASVLDEGWTKALRSDMSEKTVIIAEGLLMYFSGDEVKALFDKLSAAFPGADLFFDVVSAYFVGKGISSNFRWGIDSLDAIKELCPGSRIINSWSAGELLKERQSLILRLLNLLPKTRNRSRVIHLRLGE